MVGVLVGFSNMEGERMGKSLGNFRMCNGLLYQYPGGVFRYVILAANYRSEQSFSKDLLDSAWRSLDALYGYLRGIDDSDSTIVADSKGYKALLDDLNTPLAISELHRLAKQMRAANGAHQQDLRAELAGLGSMMGLLQQDAEQWFTQARGSNDISSAEIDDMIARRKQAKADKNFSGADQIRQDLLSRGVVLEDSREGTKWRRG